MTSPHVAGRRWSQRQELCQVLPYRNFLMCMVLGIIMSGWDGVGAGQQLQKRPLLFP